MFYDMRAEEQIQLTCGEVYQAAIDEMAGFLREMFAALRREQGHIGSLMHKCPCPLTMSDCYFFSRLFNQRKILRSLLLRL